MHPQGYRTNAKAERDETKKHEKFWRRAWRQVAMRAVILIALLIGGSLSYAIVACARAPSKKPACQDTTEIIGTGTNNAHNCGENQRMDTTRIRERDTTYVLVRCWCGDHGQPMKEETP